ncbi:MAG: hypothetical protein LBN40_03850 [Oscillospiraceae bacterium]|nr:hypothetical protein [Oscillospiraceae bacterium]
MSLKTNRRKSTRRERLMNITRRLLFLAAFLLLYSVMAGGVFDTWQPLFLVPLATAVSMRESELTAGVFGALCGLGIDAASGHLFGMTALWLLIFCAANSLLVTHLIRQSFVNHLLITAAACLWLGLMDYTFNYLVWGYENVSLVADKYIFPAYAGAALFAPLLYFLVKFICRKFGEDDRRVAIAHSENDEDYDEE